MYTRIAHRLALEQPASVTTVKKLFAECGERASAALGRASHAVPCPDQMYRYKQTHICGSVPGILKPHIELSPLYRKNARSELPPLA
jgi:hypothetical protein